MSSQKTLSLLLIAILAVAVAMFYYAALMPNEGNTGIGEHGNGTQGGSGGKLGVGVTVEFFDGTTKTVDPSQIQYTLFPLTVYFQGQPIKSVTWHAYVQVDWVGDLTSLELKGPMEVRSDTGVLLRKENMLKSYSSSDPPPKNQWFEMWKFSLTAEDIEYSLPQTGDYTLKCSINVTATAMFASGVSSVKTASASGNLPISIQVSGLTVLYADIQVQIFK